jgi:hypothetical protein
MINPICNLKKSPNQNKNWFLIYSLVLFDYLILGLKYDYLVIIIVKACIQVAEKRFK